MSSNHRSRATGGGRVSGRAPAAVAALVLALSAGTAISAGAMSGGGAEAGRLRSELARMTELANRRLEPPALRLAGELPGERDRLSRLREPASTAQAQLKVALSQLQEMSALVYDPHYLPALIAAGRAYTAVSGQDPVTGTAVNPEYLGLERELATDGGQLNGSAEDAGTLSAGVKRLTQELGRAQRRARHVERQIPGRLARAARARQR
jgi:hypothetical protein